MQPRSWPWPWGDVLQTACAFDREISKSSMRLMSEMTDTAAPREPGWYWCRWGMHNDTEHWRPCYWSGAWEVPNVQRKLPDSAWAEIGPRIYPPGQDAAQRVIEAAYAWWREEWG